MLTCWLWKQPQNLIKLIWHLVLPFLQGALAGDIGELTVTSMDSASYVPKEGSGKQLCFRVTWWMHAVFLLSLIVLFWLGFIPSFTLMSTIFYYCLWSIVCICWRICHYLHNITVIWKTSKYAEPNSYEESCSPIQGSLRPCARHSKIDSPFIKKIFALTKSTSNQLSTIYTSDVHMWIWVTVTNERPSCLKPW